MIPGPLMISTAITTRTRTGSMFSARPMPPQTPATQRSDLLRRQLWGFCRRSRTSLLVSGLSTCDDRGDEPASSRAAGRDLQQRGPARAYAWADPGPVALQGLGAAGPGRAVPGPVRRLRRPDG